MYVHVPRARASIGKRSRMRPQLRVSDSVEGGVVPLAEIKKASVNFIIYRITFHNTHIYIHGMLNTDSIVNNEIKPTVHSARAHLAREGAAASRPARRFMLQYIYCNYDNSCNLVIVVIYEFYIAFCVYLFV